MHEPSNDFERSLIMVGISSVFRDELLEHKDFVDRLKQQGMNFSSTEEMFLRSLTPQQADACSTLMLNSHQEFAWYCQEALNLLQGRRRSLPNVVAPTASQQVMTRGISPDRPPLTKGLSARR